MSSGQALHYHVHTAFDRPELLVATEHPDHPLQKAWPSFIAQTPATVKYWHLLATIPQVAQYQFLVTVDYEHNDDLIGTEKVVARANSIPFHHGGTAIEDHTFEDLPDGGWDAVLERGINSHLPVTPASSTPCHANTLSALSITIDPAFRGKGIAELLISTLKQIAQHSNLGGPVIPARPTWKSRYPKVEMDTYVCWRKSGIETNIFPTGRSGDEPFDPWLRKHLSLGARIVKIAPESMFVEADLATWSRWIGRDLFPVVNEALRTQMWDQDANGEKSVDIVIPGGLSRLRYLVAKRVAVYVEPNIWLSYD